MNTARLFTDADGGQAIRLPFGFRFKDSEVFIRRIGKNILLMPKHDPWDSFISSLDQFTDDFMAKREQPPPEIREEF